VNFGDIGAGKTAVADWQLKSSIQGKFTDYKATFEHVNGLGKAELSLIKDVKIHELIHQIKADRPTGDDNLPDFLVNEVFDAKFRPDTIYFSNSGTATVAFADGIADAPVTPADKVAQITATTGTGWSYIELVDPADGKYKVKSVVRSDGKVIKTDNVWLTDRTFPGTGRPTYENILHLVDFDSTGSYTITYSSGDTIAPTADIIDVSPDPRTTAVSSIDITFSEAIQGSTFDYQDLNLTLNGGANLITSAVTVALVSDTTYRITGLDTSNDGQYQLSLATTGLTDLDGNAGTTTATETWTKAADAPAVLAINGITNPLRNTPVTSLEFAFSQDINASTLSISDLSLTLNGGANLLTASNTITAVSGNTYQIGNIQGLTGNPGNYVFSVNAAGIKNVAGKDGIGNRSVNWQLDNVQPAVQSIDGISTSNRRQSLQQVEVTFSEAIDLTTLTTSDIILTRDGTTVALSGLDITNSSNGKYLIKGLAAAQTVDGNYQLTVNGSGISDAAGNAGTGSATANWSIDTLAPSAASGLNISISPDTGVSSTDLLTNSLSLTLAGTTGEPGTQVSLKDLTSNIDLGTAVVTGNTFSQNIVLNNTGTHQIQVHVVDATDSTVSIFVDQSAPTSSFVNSPSPAPTGIGSIDIAFSEAIDGSSFTLADLKLTRDGVVVDLSSAAIAVVSGNNYQLSGLSTLTATPGNYVLSLNNTGVVDRAGNAGTDSTVANFTVTRPPTAGIQIVQSGGATNVTEGGANDSYTVVLNTQPTSDVVVTIGTNSQLTTNKQTLTFTTSNWNISQDVTITAVDDAVTQGDRNITLTHTIASTDSNYAAITAPALNVGIRDNDAEIRGFLWEDLDGNGEKNGAEGNLANRTVYLDSNNNGQLDLLERSTTTNLTGEYTFSDLRAGAYTVAEVLPTGWRQTYPIINVSTSASGEALYVPSEALSNSVAGIAATSATLTNFQSFAADPRFASIKGQGYSTVIIDTGADLDSSFFGADANGDGVADRIIYQHDFADNDNDASDRTGHGSHVASIAAQLAPSANIIVLKVFKDSGTGAFADLEKALQWVNQNASTYNIASVNLSLGDSQNWNTTNPRYGIGDEIAAISAQNVIIAAAAGNNFYRFNSAPGVAYPAADPNTIAVGAVWSGNFGGTQSFSSGAKDYGTEIDRIASFSQRDANLLDVFAPGVFISGANATGGTQSLGGTSQATPFVSGIAVLAQQIAFEKLGRKLTVNEFRKLLDDTSTIIKDGDDENDNVVNTGASYPRIDLLNLAKGIANFSVTTTDNSTGSNNGGGGVATPNISGTQILTHLVTLAAGQIVTDKNFGSLQDLNAAPTAVTLSNIVTSLAENTSTPTKVAAINITDDALGTNTLSLSGADASYFEILEGSLYLKSGTSLNYEAKTNYSVVVNVDDATVGGSPDASTTFSLNITDVNEAPTAVTLTNTVNSLAENTSVGARLRVADINTSDDALGTNSLSLIGADSRYFEIFNSALYIKAGTLLDFETKLNYTVQVAVNDATVGTNPDAITTFNLTLTDVLESGITNGPDKVLGTALNDNLNGLAGDDTLSGLNGNDTLNGGLGDDEIYGGAGNDSIIGGDGEDYVEAGIGDDIVIGGAGNDEIYGDDGDDELYGGIGDDWLEGGFGEDYIEGGLGDDTLVGAAGNDEIYGDAGNDLLEGGEGDDWLDGGAGNDTLFGGAGEDTLVGGAGVDTFVLNKNSGADFIDDFATGDKLQVSAGEFGGGLIPGFLSGSKLLSGATVGAGSATSAAQQFLYNTTTGALYFDANGSAAGNGIQIAILVTKPVINSNDFSIVS
jgi:Ca2+-binding RTX toxin-like protein